MHIWPVIWWLLCGAMHTRAQYATGQTGKRHYADTSSQPLYDAFHALFARPNPETVLAWDMFLEALPLGSVLFLFWACGLDILPLTAFIHGWLLLFRSACFFVTLLPDASQTFCYRDTYSLKGGIHCLLFSGHTTATLMSATLWVMLGEPSLAGGLVAFGICALQSVGIVYCRKHYTVDVLLAWMIVPLWTYALAYLAVMHLL